MKLRPALYGDISRLVGMGVRFISSSTYAEFIEINVQAMADTLRMLIDTGVVLVLEFEGGIIGGMIGIALFDHPISGQKFASELFWWVEPEVRGGGVRLLHAAERWARDHGAVALHMIAPTPDVEKIYDALGYRRVEVTYQKDLV